MLSINHMAVARPDRNRKRRHEDDTEPGYHPRPQPQPGTLNSNQLRSRQRLLRQHNIAGDDLWMDRSFFATAAPLSSFHGPIDVQVPPVFLSHDTTRESWDLDLASLPIQSNKHTDSHALTRFLFPGLPSAAHRQDDLNLVNPFAEDAVCRHASIRADVNKSEEVEVNGYIKFRLQPTSSAFDKIHTSSPNGLRHNDFGKHHRQPFDNCWQAPSAIVPLLPPSFGRGMILDNVDQKLLTFCMLHTSRALIRLHLS